MIPLLQSVFEWSARPAVLAVLLGLSFVSFAISVVGVPWYLRRLPADYFSRREQLKLGAPPGDSPRWRLVLVVLKNGIGAMLVLAGIAMLVLPGQGVATLIVGLLMLDFPNKKRMQRRVLSVPPVLRAVNSLRQRAGQPPLVVTFAPDAPADRDPPRSQPSSVR